MSKQLLLAGAVSLAVANAAYADCAFENDVPVKSLSAGFEAWKAVTDAMAECGNVEAELDQEFRTKQPAGFAANPSLYHIGGVANATLVPLMNEGTIRPLDDLIAAHGQNLSPNQLIKIDGKIMAVSMMVNAQHLMYREDILNDLAIEVPASYDDILAAAEKIKEAGVVDYPLGGTMQSGWDLAQEFVNMYFGFGGDFVDDAGQPTLSNENGVAALEMMKQLTAYMDPEYLVADSIYVQQQLQQGKVAMANLWGSRARAMDDEGESQVVGKVKMAKAPAAVPDSNPASTVWWDGIVIAKNISDEEAEVAFKVAMEGMDAEMVQSANDEAVWLVEGYEVTPLATGVIETIVAGTRSYPASAEMGLMHTALGNGIANFLNGDKDAATTLADIEAAYLTAAKEAGLAQ